MVHLSLPYRLARWIFSHRRPLSPSGLPSSKISSERDRSLPMCDRYCKQTRGLGGGLGEDVGETLGTDTQAASYSLPCPCWAHRGHDVSAAAKVHVVRQPKLLPFHVVGQHELVGEVCALRRQVAAQIAKLLQRRRTRRKEGEGMMCVREEGGWELEGGREGE